MAICVSCSTYGSGRFCSECGERLASDHLPPVLLNADQENHTEEVGEKVVSDPRSQKRRLVIYGVVVVIIAALGFEAIKPAPPGTSSDESEAEAPPPTIVVAADRKLEWVVITSTAEGLVRYDPSNGKIDALGGDARVLGTVWGRVLLQDTRGQIYTVDPQQLGSTERLESSAPINDSGYSLATDATPSSRRGHVWLTGSRGELLEIDLGDGSEAQRVVDSPAVARGLVRTSPRFTSPQAGGVYRLDADGGYEQVLSGTVLAEGPESVLVQSCEQQLLCSNEWLDTDALEPLPALFAPDFKPGSMTVRTVGDGRFVAARYTERVSGGGGAVIRLDHTEVSTIADGTPVQLHSAEIEPLWEGRTDIAPDGSLVTAVRDLSLFVRAAGQPVAAQVPIAGVRVGSVAVFVPKPPSE